MKRLEDKVALVTGGSSGIGYEIAKLFAYEGARVMIVGRNEERCMEVVKEIQTQGGEAKALLCELYTEEAPQIILEAVNSAFGPIDILVNNAAWWVSEPFLEVGRTNFRKGFSDYLESVFFLTQAVGAQMIEQKTSGKIINITSTAAFYGERGMAVYCAAKAAIVNLTRAIALELGKYEICVNAIAPGTTITNNEKRPAHVLESFRIMGALPELNSADKIASAVLFLASKESDGITGETLCVDGGAVQVRMPEKLYQSPVLL